MNLSNPLTALLDIEYPLLQAPMGGESTPAMVIAVSNAGGLGGLGCSYLSCAEITAKVDAIRAGTDRPFNLNFFAHPEPVETRVTDAALRERLDRFYAETGIAIPEVSEIDCHRFDDERLELMLTLRPRVVSFHFGLPPEASLRALREAGIAIICSATTVAEARSLERAGIDAIIAQGWEAGGHRGSFEAADGRTGIGTLALVPQIVDAVSRPVIAAGGIADGRGIAAALVLGAQGAQLGTAFLACPEASISAAYRRALAGSRGETTRLSAAFSGRYARVENNRYAAAIGESLPGADFPAMYRYSYPLEKACHEGLAEGFECLIYGQAAALNRALPAAELVNLLVQETAAALGRD